MDQKYDSKQSEQPRPVEPPPAPRKRFRIEKIEERIAPTKGGESHQGSISGSIATGSSSGSY